MSIYVDRVYCNNCETAQRIEKAEDTCPECGATGTMEWLEEPVEVVGEPGPIGETDNS
jgi:RNA polymerase subunit RPABC4/transcription elongation factor Spt4